LSKSFEFQVSSFECGNFPTQGSIELE
jgi:hypothetical protein